ncbi:MAG: AraC family transcriptional regulator [Prevotella sp.]|nr:AraC family transcriptional regulator [Prevotella sp.]
MYDHIREDSLYIMLYGMVTAMAMMASCYLLFRRANAIAPDITSPVRLRRWTGVFFAFLALNHVWYTPICFLTSNEDIKMIDLVGGLFDSMTFFPLTIVVMFIMLQDRSRPLWPIAVMFAPLVVLGAFCVATHSYAFQPMAYVYALLMWIGLIIYMVHATRQYGHWLRDNYADLEHKEVWQSFVVLAIMLLVFVVYAFVGEGTAYLYAMQVILIILICYLLWRVETLSDLNISQQQELPIDNPLSLSVRNRSASPPGLSKNIGPLLKQYCEESRLYLQYDINISRLAREIGINRLYLSQYFSSQGMNYNAYINDLRINHFISLYHEAVAAHRPVIAQQLAFESGYQSYNTFRDAFKRKMGLSVTTWMARQEMEV